MKFSVLNLALWGWVGGRKATSFFRNSIQQTVPGRVACHCLDKGDLLDSLFYIPSVYQEFLVGLNCPEGNDDDHLDA
jgi:hypothetical protein